MVTGMRYRFPHLVALGFGTEGALWIHNLVDIDGANLSNSGHIGWTEHRNKHRGKMCV